MSQATVGSKYQIVIPKEVRSKVKNIKPGAKVEIYTLGTTIKIDPDQKGWVERTRGIAKEAWKGINTTKYLEELKNEWDQ